MGCAINSAAKLAASIMQAASTISKTFFILVLGIQFSASLGGLRFVFSIF